MKIFSFLFLLLSFFISTSYADEFIGERAPKIGELSDSVNLKDLTCLFMHDRWTYKKGEKVNGKELLAMYVHQVRDVNPTVGCMSDNTCFFTCFDKNNLPYSGNSYATDDIGNVILTRPLKNGLPTDGVIKNYTSGVLDLALYVEQGALVRYDIIIEGSIIKHLRMTDNPNVWHIQHFYPNGKIEAEVVVDVKENKVLQKTSYNEDGSVKEY